MNYNTIVLLAYVGWLVLMSLVTFALFAKDKKMAVKGGGPVRIKEKTLLSATAIGGACGAFLGRILCHHKTDKKYFSFTIYLSILAQAAALVVLAILCVGVK